MKRPDTKSIVFTAISLLALAIFSPWVFGVPLAFLAIQFVVVSIVIWQACDPFADAAQWIGAKLKIPGSVRGATLDAVASSIPELFTGIFFVLLAVYSDHTDLAAPSHIGDGFGSALATCAGSAVYNMILIPAFCVLVISFTRRSRPTIDVEQEVISRDGLWFLGTEAVLIAFMFQDRMYWWMGVVLLALYCVYILQLYRDGMVYRKAMQLIRGSRIGPSSSREEIRTAIKAAGMKSNPVLVDQIRRFKVRTEPDIESARVLYGWFEVPLTWAVASTIIVVSTIIAGASCFWLVEIANETAHELNVPVFFVAVILVAASSSVPDTFLSIGAARRGDDSGAVSNAFGSNIFDICVSLSIPLLLNSWLIGWEPVPMVANGGEPIAGLVDLRILLAVLTGATLLIMWQNRQLTRGKGLILCGLYGMFIAYAVAGSFGLTIFG